MRTRSYRTLVAVLGLVSALCWTFALASDGPDKSKTGQQSLDKAAANTKYGVIDINNLTTWHRNDGLSNHSPGADNGMYYPKGTGNVIYQDNVVYAGKMFVGGYPGAGGTAAAIQPIRVDGGTYGVGTKQGWVTGQGATAAAVNPNDAGARVYRVRRDYASMSTTEARADAASTNEKLTTEVTDAMIADLIAQYDTDWKNWPTNLGAPYIDRNKNGQYNAPPAFSATFTVDSLISQNRDEPGIAGADPNSPADQVLWTVYNDLDRTQAIGFEGSEPFGMETQKTVWAYKRTDALGNLYFSRYRMINKGGVDVGGGTKGAFYIDSMYVCQWSDPDLGSFSDDICGSDSLLSIGYIYNANGVDATFKKYGIAPPSAAYDFLAGPVVASPGDSAVFDLKRKKNFKNLGMSSFAYFSAGSPYSDPPGGSSNYSTGTGRWWKMLRGFAPLGSISDGDSPYATPPGLAPTKFPLSGDPVARTGFLDGAGTTYSFAPGDRRILLNTGPFRMAPGDTQDITIGVVAGLGADRLSSVAVMKFNDRFVQNTYDALFQVPKPPLPPDVKTAELDGQIILDWGSSLQRVVDIETRVAQPGAYRFEGYNVYQLPSRGSRLSEGIRVATFDTPADPTVVLDQQFDGKSGQILALPVQFGSNSGIKRYLKLKRDYVRDIDKLYNGQEYYYVVTSYSVATVPGYLPAALESDAIILTARPRVPFGKIFQTASGDTLKITHTAGNSDGIVTPIVINPAASTGNTYQVKFDTSAGATSWRLTNTATSKVVLSGETNQSGDDNYKIVEGGILLKVSGPLPGTKGWDLLGTPRRFSTAGAFTGLGLEGFSDVSDPAAYSLDGSGAIGAAGNFAFGGISTNLTFADYHTVLLRLAAVNATTLWDPNVAPADANYSLSYRYLRAAANAAADPSFVPWIKTVASGYPYQDYVYGQPFSAWDMETTPPTRLAVGHFENNVAAGMVDGRYWPPSSSGDNTASREFAFIFKSPYTTTPNPALQVNMFANSSTPLMWVMTVTRRANPDWTGTEQFQITASHINAPTDVFSYTPPAAAAGADLVAVSASKVGVFPNPYFAFNPAETNRFFKFVTFNNLPTKATFKVFNLAGQLVRQLEKNDNSQFFQWDLNNTANFPVASGIYIVYVDMPDIGVKKVLKVAIIQEQEVLDSY